MQILAILFALCALPVWAQAPLTPGRPQVEQKESKPRHERRHESREHREQSLRNPPAPSTPAGPAKRDGSSAATAQSGARCSAEPQCTSRGQGNSCKGVQRTYSGADAASFGAQDIVRRCRAANSPDPCGGACVQQCASVAQCSPTAAPVVRK